jgi:Peptidase family M48
MIDAPYVSLNDFAATFHAGGGEAPAWLHPDAGAPRLLEMAGVRHRLEDVLDTVVALQRAEWLNDGMYAGPTVMPGVYRDVLHCARTLMIAVPPAILSSGGFKSQGCFGTDGHAFLYLSAGYFESATPPERQFVAGRLCGHIAARQVTAATLYGLLADHNGVRSVARRAVGPTVDVVLAPLSVGMRLGLARWHRAAEVSADRAGLLCCGDLEMAGRALLRQALGRAPDVDVAGYLAQLRATRDPGDPGKWAELLADQPFTHKRLQALAWFARSEIYAAATGTVVESPIPADELARQTRRLLGVS